MSVRKSSVGYLRCEIESHYHSEQGAKNVTKEIHCLHGVSRATPEQRGEKTHGHEESEDDDDLSRDSEAEPIDVSDRLRNVDAVPDQLPPSFLVHAAQRFRVAIG